MLVEKGVVDPRYTEAVEESVATDSQQARTTITRMREYAMEQPRVNAHIERVKKGRSADGLPSGGDGPRPIAVAAAPMDRTPWPVPATRIGRARAVSAVLLPMGRASHRPASSGGNGARQLQINGRDNTKSRIRFAGQKLCPRLLNYS